MLPLSKAILYSFCQYKMLICYPKVLPIIGEHENQKPSWASTRILPWGVAGQWTEEPRFAADTRNKPMGRRPARSKPSAPQIVCPQLSFHSRSMRAWAVAPDKHPWPHIQLRRIRLTALEAKLKLGCCSPRHSSSKPTFRQYSIWCNFILQEVCCKGNGKQILLSVTLID